MKVCMLPSKAELGIGRVVDAYRRYLPAYGVTFVGEDEADIIATHAGCQTKEYQPHVHHCHGLYPTAGEDKGKKLLHTWNAEVIENARVARAITVPSDWVADLFRRDMLLQPTILPHGIDLDKWPLRDKPVKDGNVLWAKGHNPGVCDPKVLNDVAERMPGIKFTTTYGKQAANVDVVGKLKFENMRDLMYQCSILLAPTKETFGIQTLEAMALGLPVVGYDWGGTADIIEHEVNGWLAEPGDVDGLVDGISWVKDHYTAVVEAARQCVEAAYTWDRVIEQLYGLYTRVYNEEPTHPIVSVIIPCYNYADRVGRAIESALNQDFDRPYEVIVVNDGSTDNSAEVIATYPVTFLDIENSGVAEARNCGIRHATSEFIACLDADDQMLPHFLSTMVPELEADRGMGIVYGGLENFYSEQDFRRTGTWPPPFCYKRQSLRANQVPSCCLFRKEAWERAGGYRQKYSPAEDAELWLRITTVGFAAKKVVDEPVYVYDVHGGSLSRTMKEPNYIVDKPWPDDFDLTPFGAVSCDYKYDSYPVRNYDQPWVSIIIPVGPEHWHVAWRAVDSIWLQTLPYWECIVVNDSGRELMHPSTGRTLKEAYPFVRLLKIRDEHRGNVSQARNVGAAHAKAGLLVFLDADDWLEKEHLQATVNAYNSNNEHYIYTDWMGAGANGNLKRQSAPDFECSLIKQQAIHPVTALVPAAWHNEVGGFDHELGVKGWEDWDYYLKIVQAGHMGYRIAEPLVVYDASTGVRRDVSYVRKDELIPIFRERYGTMPCNRPGCRQKKGGTRMNPLPSPPTNPNAAMLSPIAAAGRAAPIPRSNRNRQAEEKAMEQDEVMVIENSGNRGSHTVVGLATRKNYGRKKHGSRFPMKIADQRMQPRLYVPLTVAVAQRTPATRPSPPRVVAQAKPPVQAPRVEDVVEPDEPEKLQGYDAREDGFDIGILGVHQLMMLGIKGDGAADAYAAEVVGQARDDVLSYLLSVMSLPYIKTLGLSEEEAADAYEMEAQGKARTTVLSYLESEAGDLLEFVDE